MVCEEVLKKWDIIDLPLVAMISDYVMNGAAPGFFTFQSCIIIQLTALGQASASVILYRMIAKLLATHDQNGFLPIISEGNIIALWGDAESESKNTSI